MCRELLTNTGGGSSLAALAGAGVSEWVEDAFHFPTFAFPAAVSPLSQSPSLSLGLGNLEVRRHNSRERHCVHVSQICD